MFNPISAHIELIERNNVLWKVIADTVIRTKLTANRFFRCQQIRDLNIQLFAALVAYKIDFLVACSADSHLIAPAQQFQIHYILQNEIDVPHIAAEDRLADAVIGNIVLLIGGKDLFSLQIFPLHLIEQVRLAAVSDIVQNYMKLYSGCLCRKYAEIKKYRYLWSELCIELIYSGQLIKTCIGDDVCC